MNEIFKDVPGYEGLYQVSNLGRVKSLNYNHTGKEKILKPGIEQWGYYHIILQKNCIRKKYRLHRLVAEVFLPNPNNFDQVNHKDENKKNNRVDNLEWCTCSYNVRYSQAKPCACFNDGKLIKVYNTIKETELDGFNPTSVCRCCSGKQNTHRGHEFRYLR